MRSVINIHVDKVPMQQNKLQPLVAWRALRTLLNDKEDTGQVFVIVRALTGKSVIRAYNRFAATPTGQCILNEERVLLDTLQDRARLRTLAPDSVGRAYLEFVESENLSADGLVDASNSAPGLTENDNIARYATRLRDAHDLWHAVTGYGRDGLGEVCLLGFTYAQTRNPGIALIALAGGLKYARFVGWRALNALWHGYRAGRRAAWLPAADWEHLLTLPLDDVREQLRVQAPLIYTDLKEGALAV
jgi:ubiquinone biosynthesis protein COQ4